MGANQSCDRLVEYYHALARSGGGNGVTEAQAWQTKIDWAEVGCPLGGLFSCDAAGWAFNNGEEGRSKDAVKAYRYYERGCVNGSAISCQNRALMEQAGNGTQQNDAKATASYLRACELGYAAACNIFMERRVVAEPTKTFRAHQLTHLDYITFMGCAGNFDGAHAALIRILPFTQGEFRTTVQNQIANSQKLLDLMAPLRADLPYMAPHLDADMGRQAYGEARARYYGMRDMPAQHQVETWLEYSDFTEECRAVGDKLQGLHAAWRDARR